MTIYNTHLTEADSNTGAFTMCGGKRGRGLEDVKHIGEERHTGRGR